MRPVEFTSDEIIQAGKDLTATGRNITGFALRQKVGGGNPARLRQVWEEHLASQATTKAEPVAELPVEVADEVAGITKALSERIAALAVDLNSKAVGAAERRVQDLVRSAGEHRAQAERELSDASQTVDDLETRLEEAGSRCEQLSARLEDQAAINQAQAVELAQLKERLAMVDEASRAELERANSVIATLREDATKQVNEATTLRAELVSARAKSDAAEQIHAQAKKQAATEVHRLAERITKKESERDEARKALSAAREEASRLLGHNEALKAQLMAQKTEPDKTVSKRG